MPQEGENTAPEATIPVPDTAAATTPEEGKDGKTFDADYVKQLRSEAAKYRTEAQEAKARIEEFENSQRSELEKTQAKADKLAKEAQEAHAKLLRYEIATEKGLPAKLMPLLTGASRDELEAQAALILETAKPAPADFDGGAREPVADPKAPDQEHNDLVTTLFGARSN